jgi:hypothetical protein
MDVGNWIREECLSEGQTENGTTTKLSGGLRMMIQRLGVRYPDRTDRSAFSKF